MEEYDPSGGVDNKRRMTGRHETASHDEFTFGEGSRNTSVRIPRPVVTQQMVAHFSLQLHNSTVESALEMAASCFVESFSARVANCRNP